MLNSAQIFNPVDESLAERVRAYRSTHEAWLNVEASLKYVDDPEWSDTLGEAKELEEAHSIITNSMNQASQSLSIDDIDKAKVQGLISYDEAYEMLKTKLDLEQKQEQEEEQSFKFDL